MLVFGVLPQLQLGLCPLLLVHFGRLLGLLLLVPLLLSGLLLLLLLSPLLVARPLVPLLLVGGLVRLLLVQLLLGLVPPLLVQLQLV